jgi:hypothetical protein
VFILRTFEHVKTHWQKNKLTFKKFQNEKEKFANLKHLDNIYIQILLRQMDINRKLRFIRSIPPNAPIPFPPFSPIKFAYLLFEGGMTNPHQNNITCMPIDYAHSMLHLLIEIFK